MPGVQSTIRLLYFTDMTSATIVLQTRLTINWINSLKIPEEK